jgi:hypothetical protein
MSFRTNPGWRLFWCNAGSRVRHEQHGDIRYRISIAKLEISLFPNPRKKPTTAAFIGGKCNGAARLSIEPSENKPPQQGETPPAYSFQANPIMFGYLLMQESTMNSVAALFSRYSAIS